MMERMRSNGVMNEGIQAKQLLQLLKILKQYHKIRVHKKMIVLELREESEVLVSLMTEEEPNVMGIGRDHEGNVLLTEIGLEQIAPMIGRDHEGNAHLTEIDRVLIAPMIETDHEGSAHLIEIDPEQIVPLIETDHVMIVLLIGIDQERIAPMIETDHVMIVLLIGIDQERI